MLKKIDILLVEDDENDSFLIKNHLSNSFPFFESIVTHMRSSREALSHLANNNKTDIILLDLNLPDTNGMDSIECFNTYRDIPIIVVTGDKDMELGYLAIQTGAWDFLFKQDLDNSQLIKSIFFAKAKHEILQSETKTKSDLIESEHTKDILQKQHKELEETKDSLTKLTAKLSAEKETALKTSIELKETNSILEQKNKEIEQFVFAVSHDLKSPLVSISGFTDLLIKELEPCSNAAINNSLERIQFNTKSMNLMLKDLLELYRILEKKPTLELIQPEEIISHQIKLLNTQIRDCQATISIIPPPYRVKANARLLNQCIANLLTNALLYRSTERNLEININFGKTDTETWISIQDNGVGIPHSYQHKVFELFERLATTEGSGIGLAIVKSTMDRHKGRVTLESRENEGANFTLFFPNE